LKSVHDEKIRQPTVNDIAGIYPENWMLLLTQPYCVVERFDWLPRRILSDVNDRRGVCDVKSP